MKLRTLDLFSGIGGFSLGLESTGFFETIGFVEKDKFCQKVLKKHWNNINIEDDIRNVKGEKYAAEVITGGFPCQPFSVAGKRKSTADDRYLWDEMLRVIRETKPRWVIGENVEGIVNINEGMVLRQVLTDLENEGFKSQCIIIPASGIGAWHQRKRIWIMAYSDSNRYVSEIRRGNGEEKGIPVQDREKDSTSRQPIGTSDVWQTNKEYVPNTNIKGLERHRDEYELREAKQEKNFIWSSNDGTKKSWWQIESELCGVPNGVSYELDKDRSNRIKALGNSIIPQIARQIGLSIMEAEIGN
jgi:DNA (cytosine-5)-methyltransferase 1